MHKLLLKTLAAVGTAVAVAVLIKKNDEHKEEVEVEDENEINFINILNDDEEEETETEEVDEDGSMFSVEINELKKIYPSLSFTFIQDVLSRNDELNEEFPDDTLIEITHASMFSNDDAKNAFIESCKMQGYRCEEDESGTVRSIRKMFTESGAILSEIYSIANKTCMLDGDYLGQIIEK